MERLGVFGGTFDPPHAGHVAVVEFALAEGACDRVLLVPAGRPWQKASRRDLSDAEHRVAMLHLAVDDVAGCEVSRVEVDRDGPSFTVDTLRALAAVHPGDELCLILGADAAAGLRTWRDWASLLGLARIIVVARPDTGEDARAVSADLARSGAAGAGVEILDMPSVPVSSTEARSRLRAGERGIEGLDPRVERYAVRHGLYRG